MTATFTISAGICSLLSLLFNRYGHNTLSSFFLVVAIILSICAYVSNRREQKNTTTQTIQVTNTGLIGDFSMHDDIDHLIVKSLGNSKHGFKGFPEISNNTNLPLDTINARLDLLILNNLVTEADSRRGKIYRLTPKAIKIFSNIIT